MQDKLEKILAGRLDQDIVIIGKGSSIDGVDFNNLKNCIVINTNDSELIYPGDVAVFHHGWVLDVLEENTPKCKLYISDKILPPHISQLNCEYVPYTPESADFLLMRFFSDEIFIEHAVIVTALKVANEIGRLTAKAKNVYLIGFDFTTKDGFTSKMSIHASLNEAEYVEKLISSQEHLLKMILAENARLDININHVGNKPYSLYSVDAFNHLFSSKRILKQPITKLASKAVDSFKVKVVAEITSNHFGDMERLKSMILAAKEAGADYIKLQKRDVESFYTKEKLESEYHSPFGNTFRDYRQGVELNEDQFQFIDQFCKELEIDWFISVLDKSSYEFIRKFNPQLIKLPSTISEHKDFLKLVADDFENDVVISTGYTDPSYEEFILNTFTKARRIYLLQCTSSYPTKNEDAQIGVVRHYYNLSKQNTKIIPGYSSHDIGSVVCMMAVAAGALMVEKHVKLGDVAWAHFDEVAVDLASGDFAKFVRDIRHAEKIVGEEIKVISPSEHHKYWK